MKSSQNHLPALLSAILFTLGALFLFGLGLIMGVIALDTILKGTEIKAEQTIFLFAFSFEGIVLLAAAFFSFQKFLQKPAADRDLAIPFSRWSIALIALVAGASILLGYQINQSKTLEWLFLPLLTIPAVALPLVMLLAFGIRKLPLGTRWQTWNVLGLGMSLTPLLLFILEIFVGLIIFSVILVYIMSQPELASELRGLSEQIMILGPESEAVLDLLSPYLTNPAVIVMALIYMGFLVPAIEEIVKPLGVWLFAGRLESPVQGFTLGALSGAGYALVETLSVSGQTAEWAALLLTRIGTGLLHITTSALTGAAIVLAWRERRYLRSLGIYLFAVLLHGLWNTAALLFTFSGLAEMFNQAGRLRTIQPAAVTAMAMLALVLFAILVISNHRMRRTISPASAQAVIPGESRDTAAVAEK